MTAVELANQYEKLLGVRVGWESLWREIGDYILPRRQYELGGTVSPDTSKESRLFDTTAGRAAETLANGQLAWMSPMETAWFAFEPGDKVVSEAAKRWYADCSDTCRKKLAVSNFYTSIHEFYLDRAVFGTSALFVEPGRKAPLNVQHWPIGTYVIDTDFEGLVDTVHREREYTLRAVVNEFGLENLSEKLQKLWQDGKNGLHPVKIVCSIFPRTERDPSKLDGPNKPIACIHWERENPHIIREDGYDEMPVMVSRYLEWGSIFGSVWGWAPSFLALPEARQANFLQKMMDALAEKMAFPPMLAPDELEGEVDTSAHGVTYFSADLVNRLPRPLQEANHRYDIGLERIKERQMAIEKAYHVDLFSMFAQLEKQMTAREVAARETEKLIQFSPTFARLNTEVFNPFLQRLFMIGGRNGWFKEPPEELRKYINAQQFIVEPPAVQYSSRIALALRSLPAMAYYRTLERVQMLAQIAPDVLDLYKLDEAEKTTSMDDGLPTDYIRDEDEVDEIRQSRAAQAQAEAQMQSAMVAAKAASDLGKVPTNSPVGQALRTATRQGTTPGIPTV